MKFDSRTLAVATFVLLPLSMAEKVALGVGRESDKGIRGLKKNSPKKMSKCKFPFSGLEGKLVSGLDALPKKKNKPKSTKLPSVCSNTDCYEDWAEMKSYIDVQLSTAGVTSISVGLCSGIIPVDEGDEIYVDRGIGALTNFEMVCCGDAGTCIVDGQSTAGSAIEDRTDPLITLGDIGEVLFQGIKFRNVDSETTPLMPANLDRPGAVISGMWPTVVALENVSVENISNEQGTSDSLVSGLYFTQSVVTIDGGVYEEIAAPGGISLNQGELFVRGVIFNDNTPTNAGALTLAGVKAVVRDSFFRNNIGAYECGGPFGCGGPAIALFGGSLELISNVFENNSANDEGSGGALVLYDALLEASKNVFRGNNAAVSGGAVFSYAGESIFFDNVFELNMIPSNVARPQGGGAIASVGSVLTIVANLFKSNSQKGTATINGDGGGALLLRGLYYGSLAAAVIEGNTFESNTSSADGGAIDIDGVASIFLTCNVFTSNIASNGEGGAVDVLNSDVTSKGNVYQMNTSTNPGGALRLWSSQMTSIEDTFKMNKSGSGILTNDIDMFQPVGQPRDSSLLITCDVALIVVTGFSLGEPVTNNDFYLINPDVCPIF